LADSALAGCGLELLDEATAFPLPSQDVIGGNAGAVVALMAAFDETEKEWLLERGTKLGQAILEAADRRPWGWSWATGQPGEPGLCGLAHGAGGIAWALGELEARTGWAELEKAVREALRYERSWFDRRRSNWPDLRAGTGHAGGQPAFPTWWCHGSVGAGLVRLRLHELGREEPILLAEAAAALQSSVATAMGSTEAGHPPDHGLTMCHGVGGTLELLLTAHSVLGEEEHLTAFRWLLDRVVAILGEDVERWPDGLGGPGGDPSLMTGMAGTLILLLRAAGAAPMPSVGLFPCRSSPGRVGPRWETSG
jgi:lantibiotic modifying enzyme